jgi:hypothetical protein
MKTINDFTDAELAAMVRQGAYVQHTDLSEGFLLLIALPYSKEDGVETPRDAIEAAHEFMEDCDWEERNWMVYDARMGAVYQTTAETLGAFSDGEPELEIAEVPLG